MASCSPPQILWQLLERSRGKAVLRSPHARSHSFDLKFASLDEGGDIKVAIFTQRLIGSLGKDRPG